MAYTFIQGSSKLTAAAGTAGVAHVFPSSLTAGNAVVVAVSTFTANVSTVTDNLGNIYIGTDASGVSMTANAGGNERISLWRTWNVAAGVATVTVKPAAAADMAVALHEYSGLITTDPLDQWATNTGTGPGGTSGTTSATTQATEMVFVGVSSDTNTVPSGFKPTFNQRNNINSATNMGILTGEKYVSSTGAQFGTWSWGGITYSAITATFKDTGINTIAFDSTGKGSSSATGSVITWTQTINNNASGILIAFGGFAGTAHLSSIKFAGNAMTNLISGTDTVTNLAASELWYLLNPPVGLGTFNGTFTKSSSSAKDGVSVAYLSINQTTPFLGSIAGSQQNGAASGSITTSLSANDWFVGGVEITSNLGTTNLGNERGTVTAFNTTDELLVADRTSGTLRWTLSSGAMAMVGAEMNKLANAATGGGTVGGPAFMSWRMLSGVGQ